jgi:hypothetical protein
MPYSKIDRRIWSDEKFVTLSGPAKLLAFYLLTSPHSLPLPGVIHISEEGMAADLNWSSEQCRQRLEELKWFVKPFPNLHYFWCKNAIKFDFPPNENVLKSYKKHLEMLPDPLRFEVKRTYKKMIKTVKPEWLTTFGNSYTAAIPSRNRSKIKTLFLPEHEHEHEHELLPHSAVPNNSENQEQQFEHNCAKATLWVCGQLGLAGRQMHKLIHAVLVQEYQTSHEELSTIAEYMVRTRRYYDEIVRRRGTGYLYPPKTFFEQGIWKSSKLWRDRKSNGDATIDTTDDDETD